MSGGQRIDYMDGTLPLEITAGMQVPSWVASTGDAYQGHSNVISTPGRIPGSSVMIIPTTGVYAYRYNAFCYYNGFTDNGDSVTLNISATDGGNPSGTMVALGIFQIAPIRNMPGLRIENSSDFTAITTAASCMRLLSRQVITFNGKWQIPAIDGIPPDKMIIAAHWDAAGVAVTRTLTDGVHMISAYQARQAEDYYPVTVTLELWIYGPGFPAAGKNGMAIWNGNNQCVFSTQGRPFIVSRMWNKTTNAEYVPGLVVLDCPGFHRWESGSGVQYQKYGYVRTGRNLSVQPGEYIGAVYSRQFNSLISPAPTVILPPAY